MTEAKRGNMNVYRVQFAVVRVVESVSPHAADPKNSRQQLRSSGDHSINILAENPSAASSYVKSLEGGDVEVHLGLTTEVASDVIEIPGPTKLPPRLITEPAKD